MYFGSNTTDSFSNVNDFETSNATFPQAKSILISSTSSKLINFSVTPETHAWQVMPEIFTFCLIVEKWAFFG
jgi:hypothetical protein